MPPFLRAAFLVVMSLAAASCATESINASGQGDPIDAATISADSVFNFLPAMVVVMKEVDGVPIQTSVTKVSVSPGHHKLVVTCQVTSTPQAHTQTLEVDVVPRGTYHLGIKVGQNAGPCDAVAIKTN
jgi:hypothetical protein